MTVLKRSALTRRQVLAVAVLVLVMAVGACSDTPLYVNEPQPEVPAGYFALSIERVVPPRFSSASTEQHHDSEVRASVAEAAAVRDVRLEATGSGGVLATGGRVYVHAEFVLHNDGESALEDLVLLAYHHEAFRAGSAISQALLQDDLVAPDRMVRQVRPTHRLLFDATRSGTPDALVGSPTASHFVALPEDRLPSLADAPFVRTLFPYGFRVGDGEPIAAGASATVRVAFSVLAIPGSMRARPALEQFTWNAVLLTLPGLGVTQALEENHPRGWNATLDRAVTAGADSIIAIGPGPREVSDESWCDRVIGVADVRIAGDGPTDPGYVGLVPAAGFPRFEGCEGASP